MRIGAEHREVLAPWRFLNHSCSANAAIEERGSGAVVVALTALESGDELTLDYRELGEDDQAEFTCRCASCRRA